MRSGPDLQPGDVRDSERQCGPRSPVRPQDVPRAPTPGEMCQELSGQQETKQQAGR